MISCLVHVNQVEQRKELAVMPQIAGPPEFDLYQIIHRQTPHGFLARIIDGAEMAGERLAAEDFHQNGISSSRSTAVRGGGLRSVCGWELRSSCCCRWPLGGRC